MMGRTSRRKEMRTTVQSVRSACLGLLECSAFAQGAPNINRAPNVTGRTEAKRAEAEDKATAQIVGQLAVWHKSW